MGERASITLTEMEEKKENAIAIEGKRKGGLKTMPSIFGMKLLASEKL